MEKILFLNLTFHKLTEEQEKRAMQELGVNVFKNIDEIIPDFTLQYLRNFPFPKTEEDKQKIENVAIFLGNQISKVCLEHDEVYVHLPLSHPVFMHYFIQILEMKKEFHPNLTLVYSHSARVVEEVKKEDGTIEKKSIFKFNGFILI